jgi:dTDP-4-dehydrorhamnose 3,5-epimerase
MEVEALSIAEVKILRPRRFADDRGFFSEIWNRDGLAAAGIGEVFVQENHSLSRSVGTIRGLHFQLPPFAQGKLVRVIRGRILDVAVDIRKASPSFGRWVSAALSYDDWNQIWVPRGFAHGFCTLEPDTEVAYLVDAPYSAEHNAGILWNDPDLGIDWPVPAAQAVLSANDQAAPTLASLGSPF